MQAVSYKTRTRPPGIVMNPCKDGLHMLLGLTYPFRYIPPRPRGLSKHARRLAAHEENLRKLGHLRIPEEAKWYAMRWSTEDLLLLEWRYILLKGYADNDSHRTTKKMVKQWCAQGLWISSRSSYAIGSFDEPEDMFVKLPHCPGVLFTPSFHNEKKFFKSSSQVPPPAPP